MTRIEVPTMTQWEEAIIKTGNLVSIPGFTLQIRRKDPMTGQRVIVMLGGKKGVRRIITEYSLSQTIFPPRYDWLPFKILSSNVVCNCETRER